MFVGWLPFKVIEKSNGRFGRSGFKPVAWLVPIIM